VAKRSKLKEQNRLLSESAIAMALKPNERGNCCRCQAHSRTGETHSLARRHRGASASRESSLAHLAKSAFVRIALAKTEPRRCMPGFRSPHSGPDCPIEQVMKTTCICTLHLVRFSFRVLGGSRSHALSVDFLKCRTSAAIPAKPEGPPVLRWTATDQDGMVTRAARPSVMPVRV
jgi:hypothetical protein